MSPIEPPSPPPSPWSPEFGARPRSPTPLSGPDRRHDASRGDETPPRQLQPADKLTAVPPVDRYEAAAQPTVAASGPPSPHVNFSLPPAAKEPVHADAAHGLSRRRKLSLDGPPHGPRRRHLKEAATSLLAKARKTVVALSPNAAKPSGSNAAQSNDTPKPPSQKS